MPSLSSRLAFLACAGALAGLTAGATRTLAADVEDAPPNIALVVEHSGAVHFGTDGPPGALAAPFVQGARVLAPLWVDARGGSLSLFWPAADARLSAEGVALRLVRAEEDGIRLGIEELRMDLEPGHSVRARRRPVGRVLVEAPAENPSALTVGACQTVVRLGADCGASIALDREALGVSVQAESGSVEVLERDGGTRVLLAGESMVDPCVPSPEGFLEPPEARPPLTPYQP